VQICGQIAESSWVLRCAKYDSCTMSRIGRETASSRPHIKLSSRISHREAIAFFLKNYEAQRIPKECLLSLRRNSSIKYAAISFYVDMFPNDEETVNARGIQSPTP
jgi:hypothetical protein